MKLDNRIVRTWKRRNAFSHHKTFGKALGANPLPPKNWLTRLLTQIGNTCTAYTSVGMKEALNLPQEYDPSLQWDAELSLYGQQAPDGVDMDTAMATGVETGFYKAGETIPSDKESAYLDITPTFSADMFDQIKSVLAAAPVAIGLQWYADWDFAVGPVPHTFSQLLGGHMTKVYAYIDSVEIVNGVECLCIQGTWGQQYGNDGCFYFDRYMTDRCVQEAKYWSDSASSDLKVLGLIDALLVNVVDLYNSLLNR